MNRRRLLRSATVSITGGMAGCALPSAPPLDRLYRNMDRNVDQPPLILIPGAFGSRLRNITTGEEIWPRSNASLLFSSYPDIAVEFDPETLETQTDNVQAYDIFREGLGQDFYGQVVDTLEQVGGYRRMYPGQVPEAGQRIFYIYTYDWRLDNVHAVQGLHTFLEQIAADHGDPRLQVDILAHSNGGLLCRYYARYGTADMLQENAPPPAWNGSQRIRRLLMVGTPNLGTIQPVLSHIRGEEIGLRKIPADIVASCSGAPQLMPHPHATTLVDLQGEDLGLDIYAIDTWRTLKWSIFRPRVRARVARRLNSRAAADRYLFALEAYFGLHLERGRRFHLALSGPGAANEPIPYIFGGDCTSTVAQVVVEPLSKVILGREQPDDIVNPAPGVDYDAVIYQPGDGVVTRASLLADPTVLDQPIQAQLQMQQTLFLCEAHQQLTGNPSFQNNLLYTLLS